MTPRPCAAPSQRPSSFPAPPCRAFFAGKRFFKVGRCRLPRPPCPPSASAAPAAVRAPPPLEVPESRSQPACQPLVSPLCPRQGGETFLAQLLSCACPAQFLAQPWLPARLMVSHAGAAAAAGDDQLPPRRGLPAPPARPRSANTVGRARRALLPPPPLPLQAACFCGAACQPAVGT
jgi:hypothetical protein